MPPIRFVDQEHGNGGHLVGLNQSEQFEHLIERAESARKNDECIGPHRKVEFAYCEIVKLESEIGRRIRVRLLLHRKPYIESYGRRADIRSTSVRGFHNAGAAARRDHIVANPTMGDERSAALRRDAPEAPCFFIPACRFIAGPRQGSGWQCCGGDA